MAGRPKKPMAMKVFDGTYKECEHGPVDSVPQPEGEPVKSALVRQNAVASEFWDQFVPQLVAISVATALDVAALECLCLTYSQFRESYELSAIDPTDKDMRIAFCSYAKQFESLLKEFGMTPVARERIKANVTKRDELEAKFG